jgi:hypothetical protein
MKQIFLHIGTTKTGTSSVQRVMDNNSDALAAAGVLYPTSGRGHPSRYAHHNLCYEVQEGRRSSGKFDPTRGSWQETLDEIDASSADKAVISSEAFFYCEPGQIDALARLLRGRQVTIIAYLRRQDRWL